MNWNEAVISTKSWYERNIHVYNQSGFFDSKELDVGKVRSDCSGFVSACLRKAGFVPNTFISSSALLLPNGQHADILRKAGFVPLPYDLSKAQPFDILVRPGHTEIYAGNKKSYNWGSVHDLNKGGMPSGTSHLREGYTTMWRLLGGNISILPDINYPSTPFLQTNSGQGISSASYNNGMTSISNNTPNTVYQLASTGEREDVIKLDDGRKNEFNALRESLKNNVVKMGRDIIESPELYNSSILKTSQTAKQQRQYIKPKGDE